MNNTKSIIIALLAIVTLPIIALSAEGAEGDFKYKMIAAKNSNYAAALREILSPNFNSAPPLKRGKTSTAGPFLRSLLIPGWGQYNQDRKNTALAFFGFELAMWGGMAATQMYGDNLVDDYKAYAAVHAGINNSGKDHDFYVDIGNYSSQNEFNQYQQLERDYESLYLGDKYYWQWDNTPNRNYFEDLRIKADRFKHSAIYFVGAIVVNHLVSAVEAARYHRKQEKSLSAAVEFDHQGNGMLTIIKEF